MIRWTRLFTIEGGRRARRHQQVQGCRTSIAALRLDVPLCSSFRQWHLCGFCKVVNITSVLHAINPWVYADDCPRGRLGPYICCE